MNDQPTLPTAQAVYKTLSRIHEFGYYMIAVGIIGLIPLPGALFFISMHDVIMSALAIVLILLSVALILIGYWGSRLARLTLSNASQMRPALERHIKLDSRISNFIRHIPVYRIGTFFYRGGLFDLIEDDAQDVEQKLRYLTETLPAGMGEQLLAEYKQSDEYLRMRRRRIIFLIAALAAGGYVTYWIVTHWTN